MDLRIKELQKGNSMNLFLDSINTFSKETEAKPPETFVEGLLGVHVALGLVCLCIWFARRREINISSTRKH